MGGLLASDQPLVPLAVFVACLAAFTIGHQQRNDGAGEVGLVLVGLGIILACRAWLPATRLNWLLGTSGAGFYLLWLARFWHQQLHEGRAWTTAGRLIRPARSLGYAAAFGCLVLAIGTAARSAEPAVGPLWVVLLGVAAALLLAVLLVKDAADDNAGAAFPACLMALAAGVPVREAALSFGLSIPWPVVVAGVVLLLAAYLWHQRPDRAICPAFDAYLRGFAPLMALYAVAVPGAYGDRAPWLAGSLTAALLALTAAVRWRAAAAGG